MKNKRRNRKHLLSEIKLDIFAFLRYPYYMTQKIQALYENGVLKPLEPLDLSDHQQVSLTIHSGQGLDWLDEDAYQYAQSEGDSDISLEDVRRRLASIPGSMSDVIIAERGEY